MHTHTDTAHIDLDAFRYLQWKPSDTDLRQNGKTSENGNQTYIKKILISCISFCQAISHPKYKVAFVFVERCMDFVHIYNFSATE